MLSFIHPIYNSLHLLIPNSQSFPTPSWQSQFSSSYYLLLPCLVTQSCLTLCNPLDCSLPGSSVHGILQTRILEWVAISFSRRSPWPRNWTHSHLLCLLHSRQILYPLNHWEIPLFIAAVHIVVYFVKIFMAWFERGHFWSFLWTAGS